LALKISCDCGKELVVGEELAGRKIECECGKTVSVPSVFNVERTPIQPAAPRPKTKFTWRKKLAFTAVTLLRRAVVAPAGDSLSLVHFDSDSGWCCRRRG
jgi:hypothetical protein